MKFKLATVCGLLLAATSASACYTAYDANNPASYYSLDLPAGKSPICPALVGGAQAASSTVLSNTSSRRAQPSTAPLLTDRRTASSLNLPHTVLQGEIVMVPAHAAAQVRLPTVTVVPPEVAIAQVASPATAVMGAGPAPAARKQTVITEMRDPPITVVQRGSNVSITQN